MDNKDGNQKGVENIDFEENEKEDEKKDNGFLPTNSILFRDDIIEENENEKGNEDIFKTVIFTKMVSDHKNIIKQQNCSIKSKLRNLMKCGSCKKNLQNLFFCPNCNKYACKNCFNKQYYYLKKDHTPCPLCRKMVKRTMLRPITLLKAIGEVVEEDEDESKDTLIKFNPNEFVSNCDKHKLNKVWAYCIDCNKKMCPVCFNIEEHKDHRCVNYEKYLELNVFFGNSFKNIKDYVLISEKTITDLQKLNSDLESQN